MGFAWFQCLQELAWVSVEMRLVNDGDFAELTGLTKLSLTAGNILHSSLNSQRITLDIPWQAMTALQELAICGSLVFNRCLYDLIALGALKRLQLDLHLREDNVDEAITLFLPFAAHFAVDRPQADFVMRGLPIKNVET